MALSEELSADQATKVKPSRRRWGTIAGAIAVTAGAVLIGPQVLQPASPAGAATPGQVSSAAAKDTVTCKATIGIKATGMKDAKTAIKISSKQGNLDCSNTGLGKTIGSGTFQLNKVTDGEGNCDAFSIKNIKLDFDWTMNDKSSKKSTLTVGEISREVDGIPQFKSLVVTGDLFAGASVVVTPEPESFANAVDKVNTQCFEEKRDEVNVSGTVSIQFATKK